jgi:hypothetical protein
VFCSQGDNITPPQQALGWILDLYSDVDEVRSYGQTIVYTIHETIGHLGIFVSSGVARKEHGEFSSNIDLIDTLPPGLYEAIFEEKSADTANPELVGGKWVMRCEARTLDDIRALGGNDAADERRFATAARVSEINLALYRTFVQPAIRACVTPQIADWLQQIHPLRLQYELLSDKNPLVASLGAIAGQVRSDRRPAETDNPFLALQECVSDQIVRTLDTWRDASEAAAERIFLGVYGSPTLQAAVGINPTSTAPLRKAGKSQLHQQFLQSRIAELKSLITKGGIRECVVRGALYVGMARGSVDERAFELVRRMRETDGEMPRLTLPAFKTLVREQYFLLLIDEEATLAAISSLLPPSAEKRKKGLAILRDVLSARGEISGEALERFKRVAGLFESESPKLIRQRIDATEAPTQEVQSLAS